MRNLEYSGMFHNEMTALKQIQKRTAKKMYNEGETVYLQSCNFVPMGIWSEAIAISKEKAGNNTFEDWVNNFEFYNCISRETGLYATFYKKVSK